MSAKLVLPRPRCAWLLAGLVLVPALPLSAAPLEPIKSQVDVAKKYEPVKEAKKYAPVQREPGSQTPTNTRWVTSSTTARDTTTGLTWERAPSETKLDWNALKTKCDGLVLGGHSDWRIPRVEELRSLFETNPPDTYLATGHPFTVSTQQRWTATGSPRSRYTVLVGNGNLFGELTTTQVAGWCVRGGTITAYPGSNPRFSYVDGTDYKQILDTQTNVVWRAAPTGQNDWYSARSECRKEGPGWRLATKEEYFGLMDPTAPGSPKLPVGHPFSMTWAPGYDAKLLWSSTHASTAEVIVARFSDASVSNAGKTSGGNSGYCVKGDPTAPRFSLVEGDTAVLDRDTQIVWQRAVTYTKDTNGNHVAACTAKNAPGSTGWRLPTVKEFETITDWKLDATPKLVTGHMFTGVRPDKYQLFWTADKDSYVSFFAFDIGRGAKAGPDPKDSTNFAWCVRPNMP
jgi:hypothetical protein